MQNQFKCFYFVNQGVVMSAVRGSTASLFRELDVQSFDISEHLINNAQEAAKLKAEEEKKWGRCLFTESQVRKAVSDLALRFNERHQGKHSSLLPTLLVVLEGGRVPSDLLINEIRKQGGDVFVDFIQVSSYGHGQESGELRFVSYPKSSMRNRNVIIFDDLIDSGQSLEGVKAWVVSQGAKEVSCVVMFKKDCPRTAEREALVDDFGLATENVFLYGTGLDNEGEHRDKVGLWECPKKELKLGAADLEQGQQLVAKGCMR